MNHDLGGIWMEPLVAFLGHWSIICLEGLNKTTAHLSVACLHSLPNVKQASQSVSRLIGCFLSSWLCLRANIDV